MGLKKDFSAALQVFLSSLADIKKDDDTVLPDDAEELHELIEGASVVDFRDGGYLTGDTGFVIKLPDGEELQVSIQRA